MLIYLTNSMQVNYQLQVVLSVLRALKGINLMKIAIDDYNGEKYEGEVFKKDKDEYISYNFMQDFGCTVILNKKEGFNEYVLKPWQGWKSLGKHHFEGIFSWKDPIPFLCYVWNILKDMRK